MNVEKRQISWKDAKDRKKLPTAYDLVLMDVGEKKSICGWWTGNSWFGAKLKPHHKVYYWRHWAYGSEEGRKKKSQESNERVFARPAPLRVKDWSHSKG